MKTLSSFLIAFLALSLASCGGRSKKQEVGEEIMVIVGGYHVSDISSARLHDGAVDTMHLGLVNLFDAEKIERIYTLRNVDDKPLVILQDKKSCNCVTVEYSRKPVQSGEEVPITVTFDAKGLSGKVYKPVRFRTNLSDEEYTLVVTADVK